MDNNESVEKAIEKKTAKEKKYIEKESERAHSATHVASFVLGVLAVVGHWFWYISLVCGVLAIVFGANSVRRTASKLGKAGLILGIIGLSLAAFVYISLALIVISNY